MSSKLPVSRWNLLINKNSFDFSRVLPMLSCSEPKQKRIIVTGCVCTLILICWLGVYLSVSDVLGRSNSKQAVSRERDRYGSTWDPFLYQTQGQTVCMTSKTAAVTSWSREALICHLFTVFFKHYAEDTLLVQWFPRRPVVILTKNPFYGYTITFKKKTQIAICGHQVCVYPSYLKYVLCCIWTAVQRKKPRCNTTNTIY